MRAAGFLFQRKIEEAPKLAQAEQERQRQERIERASTRRSPLDSPDILQDSRHGEDLFAERPRRQRRAQRRQARLRLLISSLAVLILVAIVIFLAIQMFNHM
jgi:Flp pilus assembly protein TadB